MLEWFNNLDITYKLLAGLVIYAFFPQIWDKLKTVFTEIKLNVQETAENSTRSNTSQNSNNQLSDQLSCSTDAEEKRILTWLVLYQESKCLGDKKLEEALLKLPAMLVNKEEENNA